MATVSERTRLIQKIHVAKRELGLDDETYRAVIRMATGNRQESSGTCTEQQLQAVLAHMKSRGFKVRHTSKTPRTADEKLIRAIWAQLDEIGALADSSEKALNAYVLRIGNVSDTRFLTPSKVTEVVETLKKWAVRVFPGALAFEWKRLHQAGVRPPFTEPALDVFICMKAGPRSRNPYSYANLRACYEQLKSEAHDVTEPA